MTILSYSNQCPEQTDSRTLSLPLLHQKIRKAIKKSWSTSDIRPQIFFPHISNHVNDVIHKGPQVSYTDNQKGNSSLVTKRHHSRRHTVDYINLEKQESRGPSNILDFQCCDQSLVKELNELSRRNNHELVRCPKHHKVTTHNCNSTNNISDILKNKWRSISDMLKKWRFIKNMNKKDKMNEKVICGVSGSSETVTVKRNGKKFVIKRVNQKKLLPNEYFKGPHPGKCVCNGCQDHISIHSFIDKFSRKNSIASDIVPTFHTISPTKSNSSPVFTPLMGNASSTPSKNKMVLDGILTCSPRNSLSLPSSRPNLLIHSDHFPSSNSSSLSNAEKTPLELLLLQARSTDLPELVSYFSNGDYYYYITKMHGVKQRKWKKPRSWLCKKYFDINWDDYIYGNMLDK